MHVCSDSDSDAAAAAAAAASDSDGCRDEEYSDVDEPSHSNASGYSDAEFEDEADEVVAFGITGWQRVRRV